MSSLCGALRLTANPLSRGTGWKFGGAKIYGMSRKVSAAEERRISEILARLRERYPDATCALHHENAYQLLVATILSAQCTDERVNQVTPELFRRYPTPQHLAGAEPEELEQLIRSTGFFRNKARSLIGCSRRLVEQYGGNVPDTMEDLLTLPGVARKTANVVLSTWFGKAEGIVVDTHVSRLAQRLGLVDASARDDIEKQLMERIPQKEWIPFAYRLILHGRLVCKAKRPNCRECFLADLCPSAAELVETGGRSPGAKREGEVTRKGSTTAKNAPAGRGRRRSKTSGESLP